MLADRFLAFWAACQAIYEEACRCEANLLADEARLVARSRPLFRSGIERRQEIAASAGLGRAEISDRVR